MADTHIHVHEGLRVNTCRNPLLSRQPSNPNNVFAPGPRLLFLPQNSPESRSHCPAGMRATDHQRLLAGHWDEHNTPPTSIAAGDVIAKLLVSRCCQTEWCLLSLWRFFELRTIFARHRRSRDCYVWMAIRCFVLQGMRYPEADYIG